MCSVHCIVPPHGVLFLCRLISLGAIQSHWREVQAEHDELEVEGRRRKRWATIQELSTAVTEKNVKSIADSKAFLRTCILGDRAFDDIASDDEGLLDYLPVQP
jgi:hypothetical protein